MERKGERDVEIGIARAFYYDDVMFLFFGSVICIKTSVKVLRIRTSKSLGEVLKNS